MNSRFTPATNLKIGTFVLILNIVIQKRIPKKLQPIRKGPFQTIDKPTDAAYKLIDSNEEKKIFQHRHNCLSYYPKEYALRAFTQLFSFTGLKVVNNNSGNSQKQTIDTNCSPQTLKTKKKQEHLTKIPINMKKKQITQTDIKVLCKDCITCQLNKPYPHKKK